jgi:hypothetical protein
MAVLRVWMKLLYNLDRQEAIEVQAILDGSIDPDPKEAEPWSFDSPLASRRERWSYAVHMLSKHLPCYG